MSMTTSPLTALLPALLSALVIAAAARPASAAESACAPRAFSIGFESLLDADFENVDGADVRGRNHLVDAPFLAGEDGSWFGGIGLRYRYRRFEYEGIDSRNRDLHELAAPFAINGRAGDWALGGCVTPAVATSSNVFKDLASRGSRDDLRLRLRLELRRALAGGAVWTFGLRRDERFGSAKLYPIFAWEPAVGPRWRVSLGLPDAAFSYRAGERHVLGVELAPAGRRWHVVSDDFADEFAYEIRAGRLETYWTFRVFGNLALRLSAGYRFARHHGFVDDRGVAVSGRAEAAPYLGIRLTKTILSSKAYSGN